MVNLDFPTRDPHLLTASGKICRRSAGSNKMVPAVLAGLGSNTKFCDAHVDDLYAVSRSCVCGVLFLGLDTTSLRATWCL